jgi:hypothetical protein
LRAFHARSRPTKATFTLFKTFVLTSGHNGVRTDTAAARELIAAGELGEITHARSISSVTMLLTPMAR